jgi:hypothetical protein
MAILSAMLRFLAGAWARLFGPEIFVVFLEYTPAHRESGRRVLERVLERVFSRHLVRQVIVDNAYERDEDVPPAEGADTIAGDNSSREFSGFDVGIAHLQRKYHPLPRSVFLLVNDTFHRSYGQEYLDAFRPKSVRASLRRNQAVGYVDCFPDEIQVLGLPIRCWIRTSLVLLTARTVDALGKLALPAENERIFGDVDQFFREDAPLSENYKRYLRAWLFGEEGQDFNERWHSMERLTAENLADFKGKARSILCEHYLSARLAALSIPIARVN